MMQSIPELSLEECSKLLNCEQNTIVGIVKESEKVTNQGETAIKRDLILMYLHTQAVINHLHRLRRTNPTYLHSGSQNGQTERELTEQKARTHIPLTLNLLRSQSHVSDLETKMCRIAKRLRLFSEQLGYRLPYVTQDTVNIRLYEEAGIHD